MVLYKAPTHRYQSTTQIATFLHLCILHGDYIYEYHFCSQSFLFSYSISLKLLKFALWLLVGADIEKGASTPLMEAAQEGHIDIVKYLLDRGVCLFVSMSRIMGKGSGLTLGTFMRQAI